MPLTNMAMRSVNSIRERVVKNNFGFKWEYFVHEGFSKSRIVNIGLNELALGGLTIGALKKIRRSTS